MRISNDGYDFTLQRKEYLNKIEEKEAILRQWPIVIRKNENQAKEIESFRKRQEKSQEKIKELTEENKQLRISLAKKEVSSIPLFHEAPKEEALPSSSSTTISSQTASINDAPNAAFFPRTPSPSSLPTPPLHPTNHN